MKAPLNNGNMFGGATNILNGISGKYTAAEISGNVSGIAKWDLGSKNATYSVSSSTSLSVVLSLIFTLSQGSASSSYSLKDGEVML